MPGHFCLDMNVGYVPGFKSGACCIEKPRQVWRNFSAQMPAQTKSVLIVDDNFNVRAALRVFVECTMGMQVCASVTNGVDAVRKAEEQKPDVVLLDLSMPAMNGLDAASLIRKTVPQAHIVVFTLFSDNLGELLAKAVGVDLVVSKTEGASGLLHALEPFLTKRFAVPVQ